MQTFRPREERVRGGGTSTEDDGIWLEAGDEPEEVVAVQLVDHPVEFVLHTAREQVQDDVPPVPSHIVVHAAAPRVMLPPALILLLQ